MFDKENKTNNNFLWVYIFMSYSLTFEHLIIRNKTCCPEDFAFTKFHCICLIHVGPFSVLRIITIILNGISNILR